MKTLHSYILRQILATLGMTVLVLTFVFVLGSVVKEVFPVLASGQASLWLLTKAIALLIPFVLVFVFPMALLTSTLLTFGRFSADLELTAVRAGGVSLMALASPILLLSIGCSVFCAWINLDLAPRSRVAYKELLYEIGAKRPTLLIRENQYQELSTNCIIYTSRLEGSQLNGLILHDVEIYQGYFNFDSDTSTNGPAVSTTATNEAPSRATQWLNAPSGSVVTEGRSLTLYLTNAHGGRFEGDKVAPLPTQGVFPVGPFDLKLAHEHAPTTDYSDMTFLQLIEEKRKLERSRITEVHDPSPILVQLHREVAFSFACIGFTLIGIPLGIRAHRRETSVGVAISLILVAIYYSFIILGQSLSHRPELGPHLIVWIPNFVFQVIGGLLLWKANRGI